MDESEMYLIKKLLYNLCEAILGIRRKVPGIRTPIFLSIVDLEPLFTYTRGNNSQEKIEDISKKLKILNSDRFGESMARHVIQIIEPKDIKNLSDFIISGNRIEIICSSEDIEDYVSELKNRTRVALRNMGHIELQTLSTGGIKIVLGDKEMKITKSRKSDKNICVNIIKLMYGEEIKSNGQNVFIDDYERTNHVSFTVLLSTLNKLWRETDDAFSTEDVRPIKDALRSLNKRSVQKLGCKLFETNDEGLKILL